MRNETLASDSRSPAESGVYNPPYSDLLPKAFEKPIEDHLRDACRATRPQTRPGSRQKPAAGVLPAGAAADGDAKAAFAHLETVLGARVYRKSTAIQAHG